jgi:hypothetical protein
MIVEDRRPPIHYGDPNDVENSLRDLNKQLRSMKNVSLGFVICIMRQSTSVYRA